jgi:hypothetical protein
MQDGDSAAGSRQVWDRAEGEPALWHQRFKLYLQLGPLRTHREAYCQAQRAKNRQPGATTPQAWFVQPNRWCWRERAQAWDAYQRDLLALSERNTRAALRQRRVDVMEDTLEAIRTALGTADIASADQEQARAWLPQLRQFLRDMLVAERQEFERSDYGQDDPHNSVAITADDLRAAQREMEAQAKTPAPAGLPAYPRPAPAKPRPEGRTLMVCTGPDSELLLDVAVLRGVHAATGLRFTRVLEATRRKFADALRRERGLGRPIKLLHLALHASAEGVQFADGVADGNWLSERLFGVEVMLLAACESDRVGDWLSVVPHAITLSDTILNEDAAALTQHFWHNIGLGLEVGEALDRALEQCPPAVAEYVVRHW